MLDDLGEKKYIKCGRVYFTASVAPWSEENEPTQLEVAARIGAIVTATVFGSALIGVGIVGGMSGISSAKGVKMDRVLADGGIMVIRGRTRRDGVYELYIDSIEYS